MSNILISHAGLMDDAVYTASSEATGFPIENVANIQPSKTWRSTGKASESIIINLGAVKTFDFIGLLHTNLISNVAVLAWIRTADTEANLTAAPDYNSSAFLAIPSGAQEDYGYGNVLFQFPADQTNQWVRIDLICGPLPDAYIEIGRVYVSKAFVPDVNIGYGWSIGIEDLTKATRAKGGASYPNALPKIRVLKYSLDFQTEDQMYDYAFAYDRLLGASKDIFIHRDIDNLDRYLDYAIYGLQQSLQPVVNKHYGLFNTRFTVRELL